MPALSTRIIVKVTLTVNNHLGEWCPEKDCCWQLTFQQPIQKSSSESGRLLHRLSKCQLPLQQSFLKSSHPNDHFQSRCYYCLHQHQHQHHIFSSFSAIINSMFTVNTNALNSQRLKC